MGIIKDWKDNNKYYWWPYKIMYLLSLRQWFKLYKWRRQRADRGWSDKDFWNAGEYVAEVTASILEELGSNGVTDWNSTFKTHTDDFPYEDIEEMVVAIRNYLTFESESSWTDGLEHTGSLDCPGWIDTETGGRLTDKQISERMINHYKKQAELYEKACKAMSTFGSHFGIFWD